MMLRNSQKIRREALSVCAICKHQREMRGRKFEAFMREIQRVMEEEFILEGRDMLHIIETHPEHFANTSLVKAGFFGDFFENITRRLIPKILPIFLRIYEHGQEALVDEVREMPRIHSEGSQKYAEEASALLVRRISDTTRNDLQALFAESWRRGESIATISGKIRAKFSDFSSYRAALIAQQETSMAYEQ